MIHFLTVEEVLRLHERQIARFGGSEGVRDFGLLESAVLAPQQSFSDDYFYKFPYEMAAAYLYHLSKNHAFVDGNKRTSADCMLTFLGMNGYEHTFIWQDLESMVVDTAIGRSDKAQITAKLAKNCRSINE